MNKRTFVLKGILLACLIGYPFKSLAKSLIQEIAPNIDESFLVDGFLVGIIILILLAIVLAVYGIFAIPKAIRDGWSGVKWMLFDAIFSIVMLIYFGFLLLMLFVDKDAGLIFVPVWIATLLLMCAVPFIYIVVLFPFAISYEFFRELIYLVSEVQKKIVHYAEVFFKKKEQ